MLTPWHILATVSLLLIMVYVLDRGFTRRRSKWLRRMAEDLHMRYSPVDRFRIAPRVALGLPIPGAADVRVRDLMYRLSDLRSATGGGGSSAGGSSGGADSAGAVGGVGGVTGYLYVFTVEYAVGTISGITRRHVVGRVFEPAGRSIEQFEQITLADETKPLDAQYRQLLNVDAPTPT